MKILYVGTERAEAQAIATAVNSLGEGVKVSWTSSLDGVATWIDRNDGLRVLVVEAQPNGSVWRSVLTYAAGLPAALPVVVIVPQESASDLQPLALEGHECVARSLLRDLPAVIPRAIAQARQRQLERAMRDMVHEQFHEAALEVERVRLRHASAVADAERLAQREAELSEQLESATTTRDVFERRLADAETAVHAGEASLADTRNASTAAEQRHASAMTAAAAQSRELQQELESKAAHLDALATAEAELQEQIRRERAARAALDAKIAAAGAALAEALRESESAAADVARLAEREASLTSELTDAHAALIDAQQRHDVALAMAAGDLAARQAHFDREQAHADVERAGLIAQLREIEEARDQARREHQSAVSDITHLTQRHDVALARAAGELAERQAHFDCERDQAEVERAGLTAQLREVEEARDQARREHQLAAADVTRLIEREASLTSELTGAHAALQDAQQRHDVALVMAAGDLAARQAHFDREQDQAEVERAGLTAQLREVEEARDQARREYQSAVADITRLTEREAELEERLTEERATRETLEQAVAATAAALQDTQQRHDVALATAAGDLADRQTHFERERAEAATERARLTVQLREVEEARDQARREHQSAVADVARLIEREAALMSELTGAHAALHDEQQQRADALATAAGELAEHQAHFERERSEAATERAGLAVQLREVEEARDQAGREHQLAAAEVMRLIEREASLTSELTGAHAALQDEQRQRADALAMAAGELAEHQAHFERERAQAEVERAGLTARLREVEEARDQARREHQSAVADITRLTEHSAAERAAAAACQTDLESRMNALRAAALVQAAEFDEKLEQLRISLKSRVEELEVTTRQREVLQAEADQLAGLRHELQQSRADNHRVFQQAPVPMFRCSKDGVLTHANRLLTTLVGRSAEELRGANLAAATFESPNDLSWLIERCLSSKIKESTETTWRRKDGSRLLVRLSACATSSDLIECGVEDLTPIRVLQDRLSQAHRMEAVGRLANEVAVTCSSLLAGVHQNVQQWLLTDGGNHASRQHGEMLLEEISRAAGLLRQLATYGDEESRRPAVVELRTVVREVAPVLKRVAGDAVEVQLPAASAPLNVDAGAERVKRLLVNLAAYGRERMPFGGRLKIELGTIVVDRHFAAKHPNVRLGPHALVTVTESRRATRTDGPLQLDDNEAGSSSRSVAVQTGVDLGTLQELVAECGGHLWMTVEPVGDMVVKIRLPLVTSYGEPPRRTLAPGGRVRLGRWFEK